MECDIKIQNIKQLPKKSFFFIKCIPSSEKLFADKVQILVPYMHWKTIAQTNNLHFAIRRFTARYKNKKYLMEQIWICGQLHVHRNLTLMSSSHHNSKTFQCWTHWIRLNTVTMNQKEHDTTPEQPNYKSRRFSLRIQSSVSRLHSESRIKRSTLMLEQCNVKEIYFFIYVIIIFWLRF